MRTRSFLVSSAIVFGGACSASDPAARARDTLSELSTVYVPIEAASLLSLTSALEDKGYGNVTAGDFKRQFVYAQASFGTAVVGYSRESDVPETALFEPIPPAS